MTPSYANGSRPLVMARDLYRQFPLGSQIVRALHGVSLDIPAGQFISIMGKSGSGKSTLLYVLGGLDRPDSGAILMAGQRLDGMSSDELAQFRRETVGFVFQAYHLVPTLTALENVALPGVFAGMPREDREPRAARLLQALEMDRYVRHRPSQMSGGQQQRVAIARALFNDPPIIMADEPTGALDSQTGEIVMTELRRLCDEEGKTIIVVTHDKGVAGHGDRVVRLKDGEVIADRQRAYLPEGEMLYEE